MKTFFSFKSAFLVLALTLFAAVGCKDQDNHDPYTPNILSAGLYNHASDTTISVGSTITLTPQISFPKDVAGNEYEWYDDANQPIGKNQPLVLSPTQAQSKAYRLVARNADGESTPVFVTIKVFYSGPFFVINEGSYGKTMGSLTRVNANATPVNLAFNAFQALNAGQTLGNTTCYGTRIGDQYFFISKQGNRVVSTDLNLTQKAVATQITDNNKIDGRSIVGVSATEGVIATSKGAFKIALDLNDISAANTPLIGTENKQCGDMFYSKPYLFVVTADNKLQIYSSDNGLALAKTIDNVGVGFTTTPDGRIWCGLNNTLTSVNPQNLAVQTYTLPTSIKIYPLWGAWKPGAICAHPKKNVIYFPGYASAWGGGNQIYKMNVDAALSTPELVYTGGTDDYFYGSGMGLDPVTGNLIANFTTSSYGNDKNSLVIINTDTQTEIQRTAYDGYYFPETFLFYNDEKK